MERFDVALFYNELSREEFDYLKLQSTLVNSGYASPTKKIHDLIKAGTIIPIKKGLYIIAPKYSRRTVCKETLANLIYGPSYVSLEYALSYYRLIPEQVPVVTSVTFKRDKYFETPIGTFTYRYLGKEKYSYGLDLVWVDKAHPVFMAIPEKALCDYIVLNKISHLKTFEDARNFLVEDLRIDPKDWARFHCTILHQLNQLYKNKIIEILLSFLEGVQS